MELDARTSQPHPSSSASAARRQGEANLLRTLERSTSGEDSATMRALRALVDILVTEGLTPEGTVIAVKEAVGRAHFMHRFEPLFREHVRAALVSECIDHYFVARGCDDVRTRSATNVADVRQARLSEDSEPLSR
jgi:hypothetical protein